MPLLEICCYSLDAALAAQAGGASRIELCAGPGEGGTTPSRSALRLAQERLSIPVRAMVRPRGGDFLYSDTEFELMRRDILDIQEAGLEGVVFGLLLADGRLDYERTARLVELARPLKVAFHRAFDMCREPEETLEQLIRLGVDTLLSSGQRPNAEAGIPLLRQLVVQAAGRIEIMPGCGINENNLARIRAETGASAFHSSATVWRDSGMTYRNPAVSMGKDSLDKEYLLQGTSVEKVAGLVKILSC
ncbi:MAG: hypothetical protein RL095_3150 [Verrucomicrobiota bacterium]|jgi:copper homeostasis protein